MEHKPKRPTNRFALLFPLGLWMGIAVGVLLHNIGAGLAIGAGIGTTLSLLGEVINQRTQKERKNW